MKKYLCVILTILFLNSSFSVRAQQKSDNNILSSNDYSSNGKKYEVIVRMIQGKVYTCKDVGPYYGLVREGTFVIQIQDAKGKKVSEFNLSKAFGKDFEPMIFMNTFKTNYDDYNGDGSLDFTIGQYGSSNGNVFKMFTINRNLQVQELKVKNYPTLFIADHTYSTKLQKFNKYTFIKNYYDNSKGKHLHDYFKWNGKEFIYLKTI